MYKSKQLLSRLLVTFIFLFVSILSMATGVRGTLTNQRGEPLAFATIYVHQTQSGTTSNFEGNYEIRLEQGQYDITFQYLGYETVTRHITVQSSWKMLNVVLNETSIQLKSATVIAGKEDPAYTLIRKAIAKAPFHDKELDWYTAEVYIKGSGRVVDAPFFFRKILEEQGLDSNTAFISETVMNVEYQRPSVYKSHIVSTRTSGQDNNTSQNAFLFATFYEQNINGSVSPLSRKAFAYYRYQYIESFSDRGYTINKIRVIPRSKGEGVYEGFIYLVENDWNLYRINLVSYQEGIKMHIRVNFVPVEEKIWLPVNEKIDFYGKFFGVKFEYKYLATVGKYKWKKNPDLDFDVEIIDEKTEAEVAAEIERLDKELMNSSVETLKDKKEAKVTRKQLRKMLEEYEKEQENKMPENKRDVTVDYTITTDSLAGKKDSIYWAQIRSVPLDLKEQNGYRKLDSIMVEEKLKAEADSIKHSKFSPVDLFFGHTFEFNDTNTLRVFIPMSFNTVDGFLLGTILRYKYQISDGSLWQFKGETHYGFSRATLLGSGEIKFKYIKGINRGSFSIGAGKMDVQINSQNPIDPYLNTFTTLLMEDNWMKLYQSEFVNFKWEQDLNHKWHFDFSTEFNMRTPLQNYSNFTIIKYHNRAYTDNTPKNMEYGINKPIDYSNRWWGSFRVEWKPFQKLAISNGLPKKINSSSPLIWLGGDYLDSYYEDISNRYNQTFFWLKFGYTHTIPVRGLNRLKVNLKAGVPLISNSSNLSLLDYQHFMGNQTPFVLSKPATQFRMLPYYSYSTKRSYAVVMTDYEFRKFLFTQFFVFRLTGLKEHLFAHFLLTEYQYDKQGQAYFELGYTLDNLFRIFQLEVVTNNLNGPFNDWAIRLGFTTNFTTK